jgi:hypothetical protein
VIFENNIFENSKSQGSLDFDRFANMSYQLYLKFPIKNETANQNTVFFYLLPDWSNFQKIQKALINRRTPVNREKFF